MHGVRAEVPPALWLVTGWPVANVREIQRELFSFLSSQLLILRQVFPTPSEVPFLCPFMFFHYTKKPETTVFNWPVQCHAIETNGLCEITYLQYRMDLLSFLVSALLLFSIPCESMAVQRSTSSTTQFRLKPPEEEEKKTVGTARSFLPGSAAGIKEQLSGRGRFFPPIHPSPCIQPRPHLFTPLSLLEVCGSSVKMATR